MQFRRFQDSDAAKNYGSLCQTATLQLPQPYSNKRGTSLPPSALPRPPRTLKPPTKIQYDRLSDVDMKSRSQTPPKIFLSYRDKMSDISPTDYGNRDFVSNLVSVNESVEFSVRKDGRIKAKSEFSRPDFTSRKYYQRLEENPTSKFSPEPKMFKRSLLPKYTSATPRQPARDSEHSSESTSTVRNSPIPLELRNSGQGNVPPRNPPPKFILDSDKAGKSTTGCMGRTALATLPPKPNDNRNQSNSRRCGSVSRGENRYRIQF